MTTFNEEQKLIRKKLDAITKEKIRISALDRSTHLGERKSVDTSPDWEGDKRFNERDKPPL